MEKEKSKKRKNLFILFAAMRKRTERIKLIIDH
jgi:hypothetical protein